MDCVVARAPRNDENGASTCILAARNARLLHRLSPPKLEGAGNAGRWQHPWPACNKKSRRQSPQVRRTIRHSLRDGLRLMVTLPGGPGFDSPRHVAKRLAKLDLSVGRPGPHAFARPLVASLVSRSHLRPPQPASRFVTIGRNVPLDEAEWAATNHDFCFSAINLFLHPGLESAEDIGDCSEIQIFRAADRVNRAGLKRTETKNRNRRGSNADTISRGHLASRLSPLSPLLERGQP
jgi:hypothetical protein